MSRSKTLPPITSTAQQDVAQLFDLIPPVRHGRQFRFACVGDSEKGRKGLPLGIRLAESVNPGLNPTFWQGCPTTKKVVYAGSVQRLPRPGWSWETLGDVGKGIDHQANPQPIENRRSYIRLRKANTSISETSGKPGNGGRAGLLAIGLADLGGHGPDCRRAARSSSLHRRCGNVVGGTLADLARGQPVHENRPM